MSATSLPGVRGRTTTTEIAERWELALAGYMTPVGLRGMNPHRDTVDFVEWIDVGKALYSRSNSNMWALGDWLRYGNFAYGKKYQEAIVATGLDYQTLANCRSVAEKFSGPGDVPPGERYRRRENLSFSHHAEVASMDEAEQDDWLDNAQAFGWSVKELREHVREARRLPADARVRVGEITVEPLEEVEDAETTSGEQSPTSIVLRLSLEDERLFRWQAAADRRGMTLTEFALAAGDTQADSWLEDAAA